MEKTCSVDDCDRKPIARTLCRVHWTHWRRYGDPTEYPKTGRPCKPAAERFWPKVARQHNGCWEWQGARDSLGYGFFRAVPGENMRKTHRVAWELTHGPIPEGLFVCHRCDNPPCVNPDHLFLGTHAENQADKAAKGRARSVPQYGETSPNARVTLEQVLEIRRRYAAGDITQRELGEHYGISQTQAGRIVRGDRWGHVKD